MYIGGDDSNRFTTFCISENIGNIGSGLTLNFINSFKRNVHYSSNFQYVVRDIPIESHPGYYLFFYSKCIWNLQSPNSDKILHISRDSLIYKVQKKMYNELADLIFPVLIEDMVELFERTELELVKTEKIAIEYFHLGLTAAMLGRNLLKLQEICLDFELPGYLACSAKGERILLRDFFKYKKFCLASHIALKRTAGKRVTNEALLKRCAKEEDLCVIFDHDYLEAFLVYRKFKVLNITKNVVGGFRYSYEYGEIDLAHAADVGLMVNEVTLKETLSEHSFSIVFDEVERSCMRPILPYSEFLAVKKESLLAINHRVPMYSDHAIITPFRNSEEFRLLRKKLGNEILRGRAEVKKAVLNEHLTNLVPKSLINWIIINSSMGAKKLNEQMIEESYLELITDQLMLFEN